MSLHETQGIPLWLVAELTYRCPLKCPYCSNPVNFDEHAQRELDTTLWKKVLSEARALGAVQLGFTGGEPLLRNDLEELVEYAHKLGFYTNLITSGIGLTERRIADLKSAGLDHIQLSFQAANESLNNNVGGAKTFARKQAAAALIKAHGFPMVLNVVLHRLNIDTLPEILKMADELGADSVELANVQFDGWAFLNRSQLLPTRAQVLKAQQTVATFREQLTRKMDLFFILPDYYEKRPKPCSAGWGSLLMVVSPDGAVLPCHGARKLPLTFPNAHEHAMKWIWESSAAFNAFRGFDWMPAPCRSCPDKEKDFGGCRCQAFLLTGDARNADPVCEKSPFHVEIDMALRAADDSSELLMRTAQGRLTVSG